MPRDTLGKENQSKAAELTNLNIKERAGIKNNKPLLQNSAEAEVDSISEKKCTLEDIVEEQKRIEMSFQRQEDERKREFEEVFEQSFCSEQSSS